MATGKLANPIDELLELIEEYVSCSNYCCKLLKELYSEDETLLGAKNSKLISKEGLVDGVAFYFHGRGCLFEFENGAIEVEFGPEGRWDGFDSYRLKFFLESRKSQFGNLAEEKVFDSSFETLIKNGDIIKHPSQKDDYLYYLSKNVK
jgi:hypothetical protein